MSEPTNPQTAPVALRPRRELLAWRNAIFVIFALSGLSIATWVARIPAIRDNLELTTGAVGLLILGMSIGSILGLVASQHLLARLGPRHGMQLTLGLVATGLLLIGVGASLVPLEGIVLVGLIIFGFGNGALDVMMNVEGAAAEQELGKTVMPLMHACFSFGTVAGAGLGALASAAGLEVFWHALVMAVVIAIVAVVAVRFVPAEQVVADELDDAPKAPWQDRLRESLSVWADGRLILIGVIMLGMAFAEGSANDWLALAVVDGHEQSNTTGALVYGVFVTAMTVGRIVGGPLIDRFGRVPVLQVSAAAAIAGLVLFILTPVTGLMVLGTVLWGLGASLGFPVGMSAAADDSKRAAARVSAVAMIGYCAFLVGPPLIGILGDAIGLLNALFVVLVLIVFAGLASPAARESSRRKR
ncbi:MULTISPECIES: MFS transporter [unclassified Plantibacter]|uniref:MFS transporter n=1 Tax=unclassified Plantibacter TaxID=2624265 RepID=UPI001783F95D|nr:MFS transporter [Plantibacter sp. CFBP 13570]MBD8101129.1 MFS transporter [Plantibacter sp. CFBP 8775]MBD8534244.1 MFS transporter [Plantibacter sp. CFBP 13570]